MSDLHLEFGPLDLEPIGEDDPNVAMSLAANSMNDHRLIWERDHSYRPGDAARRHRKARSFLEDAPLGGSVVLTHHLPSRRSIAGRYADSRYNAAYASNLDDLVERSGAALWVHGHTHVSQDYRIGNTRVLCNPRGYHGYEVNPDFNPNLIVEIGE